MIANGNDLEWGGLVLGMFLRLFRCTMTIECLLGYTMVSGNNLLLLHLLQLSFMGFTIGVDY